MPTDDVPARSGGVLPPPSLAPGDAPDSIEVPRMEPPPPSLEAMVEGRGRVKKMRRAPLARAWWVWLLVALITAAATAYVMR